jgi:hypothetical protein
MVIRLKTRRRHLCGSSDWLLAVLPAVARQTYLSRPATLLLQGALLALLVHRPVVPLQPPRPWLPI